jgi:hypothetical protein
MIRIPFAALALLAASHAHAYCIHNDTDREVSVAQERHPDSMRDERKLHRVLAPKSQVCCEFHKLDCNPGGCASSASPRTRAAFLRAPSPT